MHRGLSSALALLILPACLLAQAPDPTIRLTLRPAAEPVPALKYSLMPDVSDELAENAVVHYSLAILNLGRGFDAARATQLENWAKAPLQHFPSDEVHDAMRGYKNVFAELELAGRCERCDWGMVERLRRAGPGALLPEVQHLRELARLLSVRARLEIAEGHFEDAVRSFRTGLALGRHTAESPTLINSLVGIAVAGTLAPQIETFLEQPGAPNLYWALAGLPRPLFNMQRPLQGERLMIDYLFPGYRATARMVPLSARELKVYQDHFLEVTGSGDLQDWKSKLALAGMIAKLYPEARKRLEARGAKPAELAAMPLAQVVLLNEIDDYERLFDDMAKWSNLPYPEARVGLERAEARLKAERAEGGAILAGTLLPGLSKSQAAFARIDRRFAALRCLEAIRLYAAGHDGKLPDKLNAIAGVPVPTDPVTGGPFEYTRDGDKALLIGPAPGNEQASPANSLRYELRMTKAKL